MLDIRFVRENPDAVKENIKKKFQEQKLPLVDKVIELDAKNRAVMTEANALRAERNTLSKQVGMLMGQAKKDPSKLAEAEAAKAKVTAQAQRLAELEAEEEKLEGEIRDIMNTVLVAEKRAQANVVTRREEVASTRSLLNTARLMEENPTLYKLKELEYIEKICERVGNISLSGGDFVEQLKDVLHLRKGGKT